MRDEVEIPMLPAEIVGLDVTPWFRSILVDRGSEHGVLPGNPVVTQEGVVGVVTATSPHAAKTMLLLDHQSAVDALVQRSRARGIVRGAGHESLEFEFFVRESDVVVGDEVVTSGPRWHLSEGSSARTGGRNPGSRRVSSPRSPSSAPRSISASSSRSS